jgi:hypothetical protein
MRPARGDSTSNVLGAEQLRWRCPAEWLPFETTKSVMPAESILGQDAAAESLRFGLITNAPGHHVFVRGLAGTGRVTLVREVMERIKPLCPPSRDYCYVRNFDQPERPKLIALPRSKAAPFAALMDEFAEFLRGGLQRAMSSDQLKAERAALDNSVNARIAETLKPFEKDLQAAGLGLVTVDLGPTKATRVAAFVAGQTGDVTVSAVRVHEAVRRRKRRGDLPARRFREYLANGTIQVQLAGAVVGQINGLAVVHAGPLVYGFPQRITATVSAGSAGVINIDREAELSGAIHTKGFYILGGLLRELLKPDHPFAFDASIAFEQSYGGIDGDSASGAEVCCLLSALTDVPLRQDLAMTGAIDQKGHVMAIGAANEKIEGFFDTCRDVGFTGAQGVIIPESNVGDLVLRPDVVQACAEGKFRVVPVRTIGDAIEALFAVESAREGDSVFDQVIAKAQERVAEFWAVASKATAPRG